MPKGLKYICFLLCVLAQISVYAQRRLGVFDVRIVKQEPFFVEITCQVANTGTEIIATSPKKIAYGASILIEFDTATLPLALQGREALIANALREASLRLRPGQVRTRWHAAISLEKYQTQTSPADACADLVFDTVYLSAYTSTKMQARFVIRNQGNKTVSVLGKTSKTRDNLAVNVYFISGMQLTRGAILAGAMHLREGRESIDGLLQPGQSLEGLIDLDLRDRTRFSPNLAFELAPGSQVEDCNRSNNVRALAVEY
jgi:hypothetical protein